MERSADLLVDKILSRPDRLEQLKVEPGPVLFEAAAQAKAEASAFDNDPWLYRLVISFLGATVVLVVLGTLIVALFDGGDTPEALVALGSAAVGALAGILAPSPNQRR